MQSHKFMHISISRWKLHLNSLFMVHVIYWTCLYLVTYNSFYLSISDSNSRPYLPVDHVNVKIQLEDYKIMTSNENIKLKRAKNGGQYNKPHQHE